MTTAYRDCPICGACETVQINLLHDSDDVRDWDYPEITDLTCGCDVLSAEQADAILKEFESWDMNDWMGEP